MRYIAIIDTDEEFSEDAVERLEDTIIVGDEEVPFRCSIISVKKVSEETEN